MIKIIAIGKKHEGWIFEGLERYQKRLKKPFDVEWVLLPHSAKKGLEARQNESQALLERLKPDDYVILLDESGKLLDSPALSTHMATQFSSARSVVMVVGGAYGVDVSLKTRANFIWSLSPLVFPHQMVQLLLIEQIYRAQSIAEGNPYHHV